MIKHYKVLTDDMTGGLSDYVYTPRKWLPEVKGELVVCENGYHVCRVSDLLDWLNVGPWLYEVAIRGDVIESTNKVCARQVRLVRRLRNWNERTQRLFACDCAERVLPVFERQYPNDARPRDAIEAARRFANGKATNDDRDAACAAAWAAARDAARDAAWDAARDAAWAAARDAARDAAWDAARDAAGAAAGDAASDAEREWQTKRLLEYIEGRR